VPLKQHLAGRRLHINDEAEMAVRECLRRQETDFFHDGILKPVPSWDKCTNVLWNYAGK
jgi:hypothetical protein